MVKFTKLMKSLFSGIIGGGIFFALSIFLLAIVKIFYNIIDKDLFLSKYDIGAIIIACIIIGFINGIVTYRRKKAHYKIYKLSWSNAVLDIILSLVFTIITYKYLEKFFFMSMTLRNKMLLFIVYLALFYIFSTVSMYIYTQRNATPRKRPVHKGAWYTATLFNPIFMIIYFWIFTAILFTALHTPCNVTVAGIDDSAGAYATRSLDITPGEEVISIDGVKIASLQDVKDYINSLESTKVVALETNKQIYYVRTYEIDGKRYMGIILKQDMCPRKY